VLGLAAALIVAGVAALPKLHNDVLPELSSGPVLEVQTEALGLSSQEVEQYLTVPLENNLLDGIMGVWDVRSDSVAGLSKVDLYFEPGTTELHARQLVEERLTNAFSLPNVAKPPQLIEPLSTASRALMVGLTSRTVSPLELSYLARWIVKPRLSGVPGVANVAIFGQEDRQIQVQVDPRRLAQRHVTLSQVIDTAGNSQLVSPLSYLEGSAPGTGGFLDGPNQRLDIRPVLPLSTPRDLAAVPIADAPGDVSLGQVANIIEGHQPLIGDALSRGTGGLVLLIQKLPSASLVGVTNGVLDALAQLQPALHGVSVDTSFYRPATYVSNALRNLDLMLGIAAALAVVGLGAVLLDLRGVLVASVSVALSLTGALLLLEWRGQTLNSLIVLGLLVASVVLVDDAVAGAQALRRASRHRAMPAPEQTARNGHSSRHTTVVQAFARLRGTLGYAALIVLVMAAPVFFSRGLTARYLHPMFLSLALAVLCSTVIAVTVTPALGLLLLERPRPRSGSRRIVGRRFLDGYEAVVRATVALPRGLLIMVALIGLAGAISLPFLHEPARPRVQDHDLVVQWSGPPGAGLAEMNRLTQRTVRELRALPAVADAAATLGRAVSGDRTVDPSSGQIYVALKASADYDKAVNAVRQVVLTTPGIDASVSTYEADQQAGVLAPASSDLTVRLYGEDYGVLQTLGRQVQRALAGIKEVGHTQLRLPTEEPNIEVAINDARARNAGVLPGDARRQASTLVSGLTVGNFFEDEAVFDVVVIGEPALRTTVQDIGNLPIDTAGGGHVNLSSIAQIAVRPDPVDIQHQALSRYVDVVASVRSGRLASARHAVARAIAPLRFPLTYRAEVRGGTPDDPTPHALFVVYLLAAVIGAFLLLQAAFSSWRLAAMLLLSVSVSLGGGVAVAFLTGEASSLGTDAGLLAVLAFALRQGALFVVELRRQHAAEGGRMRPSLIVLAARERIAPSLQSAGVIAAVTAPFVAFGDVAGNEMTHAAAAVILGGLLTATVWSQLLLPALCFQLDPPAPRADEPLDVDPVSLVVSQPDFVVKGKI
jgi:Cu/Ag efflux pump CusA